MPEAPMPVAVPEPEVSPAPETVPMPEAEPKSEALPPPVAAEPVAENPGNRAQTLCIPPLVIPLRPSIGTAPTDYIPPNVDSHAYVVHVHFTVTIELLSTPTPTLTPAQDPPVGGGPLGPLFFNQSPPPTPKKFIFPLQKLPVTL